MSKEDEHQIIDLYESVVFRRKLRDIMQEAINSGVPVTVLIGAMQALQIDLMVELRELIRKECD